MIVETLSLAIALAFPNHTRAALCVAEAESKMNPTAISRTGDYGLFQIHQAAHPEYARRYLLTVAGNIRAAVRISRNGRDWSAWAPRTRRICDL